MAKLSWPAQRLSAELPDSGKVPEAQRLIWPWASHPSPEADVAFDFGNGGNGNGHSSPFFAENIPISVTLFGSIASHRQLKDGRIVVPMLLAFDIEQTPGHAGSNLCQRGLLAILPKHFRVSCCMKNLLIDLWVLAFAMSNASFSSDLAGKVGRNAQVAMWTLPCSQVYIPIKQHWCFLREQSSDQDATP